MVVESSVRHQRLTTLMRCDVQNKVLQLPSAYTPCLSAVSNILAKKGQELFVLSNAISPINAFPATPARGLVVSASASVLAGLEFDSRPGFTKTL